MAKAHACIPRHGKSPCMHSRETELMTHQPYCMNPAPTALRKAHCPLERARAHNGARRPHQTPFTLKTTLQSRTSFTFLAFLRPFLPAHANSQHPFRPVPRPRPPHLPPHPLHPVATPTTILASPKEHGTGPFTVTRHPLSCPQQTPSSPAPCPIPPHTPVHRAPRPTITRPGAPAEHTFLPLP